MKARQILEALRLGIVPELYAEEFTFGRDEEISKIKIWLANSEGSLILIGEYGSGKTHLLHNVFYSAIKDNWAAAMISLDPNEQAFHKPKTIYEYVVRSLRFKDQNGQHGDFREFLRMIATNAESYKLSGHKYLSKTIRRIKDDDDNKDFWEWIEGRPTETNYRLPKMYEQATSANIYCYILSGIGWAAKNILGLNGLTILFDEAESVDPGWFTHYQYNKAKNFTKGIVFTSKNDKRLIEDCEQKFYEHPVYKGWWGAASDLQYCGYSRLPFLWKDTSCLKLLFAFAPEPHLLSKKPFNELETIEIENLKKESLIDILEKIALLYNQAYNFETDWNFLKYVPPDKTRIFIKGVIEALDLMRHYPEKLVEEILVR